MAKKLDPLYYCSRAWIPVGDTGHRWPSYFGVVYKGLPVDGRHYLAELDTKGSPAIDPLPVGWTIKNIDLDALHELSHDAFEPWDEISRAQFDRLIDGYIMPPFGDVE